MHKGIVTLALLVVSAQCYAQERHGSLAFVIDNDLFVGTDEKYTNGVRLSWLGEAAEDNAPGLFGSGYSSLLKNTLDFLPVFGDTRFKHSASLAIQQIMITPDDIDVSELLPNQAPYVGILTLESALYAWDDTQFHELQLAIGVVGPDAGAKQTQKAVHKTFGAQDPKGWDNQVARKTIGELAYTYGHRVARSVPSSHRAWDFTMNYGVRLGNLSTDAIVGGVFRWGSRLPQAFNVFYAGSGSESAMLGLSSTEKNSGWFLYGALVGEANAYSYIDEAVEDTHNLSQETLTGSLVIGAAYFWGRAQLGFSLQGTTSVVEEDKDPISYGSLYLIWTL